MGLIVVCLLRLTSTSSLLMQGLVQREKEEAGGRCWLVPLCPFARKQFVERCDSCSHPNHWHREWVPAHGSGLQKDGGKTDRWIDRGEGRAMQRSDAWFHLLANCCYASERMSETNQIFRTIIGDSLEQFLYSRLVPLEILTVLIWLMYSNVISVWVRDNKIQ